MPRFRSMVNAENSKKPSARRHDSLVDDVLSEYNSGRPALTWCRVFPKLPTISIVPLRHSVFDELSELKGYRGVTYRTELEAAFHLPRGDRPRHLPACHPWPRFRCPTLVPCSSQRWTVISCWSTEIEERFGFIAKNNRSRTLVEASNKLRHVADPTGVWSRLGLHLGRFHMC